MTFEIVGYKKKSFNAPDGTPISGYDLHLFGTENGVTGNFVERIFASDRKLGSYIPSVGDSVDVQYNRYGKIDRIEVI